MSIFADLVEKIAARDAVVKILDVGGTIDYWNDKLHLIKREVHITVINNIDYNVENDRFKSLVGDARDMGTIADKSFDIVHSNSVIEHVGRWVDMVAMAREIERVAPTHFVQTPNFWFPVEPHARTPLLHWLPEPLRCRIVMHRKCGFWAKAATVDDAMNIIQSSELIDEKMLRSLFPNSEIYREKYYGLTKSITAIRA